MENIMEELVIEAQPTDKEDLFAPQVEMNAQRAELERKRREAQEEKARDRERAEEARKRQLAWEEQKKAARRAEKRASRVMNATAFGLALIVAGSVYMNYVDGFPIWISEAVSVGGMSILSFLLGWIFGYRARR